MKDHKIRWKRKSSLGKGTFGEVFLGVNLRTKSLMAIKEINFANVPQQDKKVHPQFVFINVRSNNDFWWLRWT